VLLMQLDRRKSVHRKRATVVSLLLAFAAAAEQN